MSAQVFGFAVLAAAAAGWVVVWRGAYRLRAPLQRLGTGPRIANYLLIALRGAASVGLVVATLWWLEQRSGRGDVGEALAELGLHARLPTGQVCALSALMFAACYAINLGFTSLRRTTGRRPKLVTVNLLPETVWERVAFSLVLSPAAGIGEEIVYRGFLQWAVAAATGDPISAVGTQAVLFGMVHAYQGGLGILRTFALGLVLGTGTLASGSLVPAMIAHTLLDIASGIGRTPPPARTTRD